MTLCKKTLLPAILLLYNDIPSANGYVTSGLPAETHTRWLTKITGDLVQSVPGYMTPEMVDSTPMLMSAWAQNPYDGKRKHMSHGMDCALTVEQLLKRLVDERKAGNENAVPNTIIYNLALEGWAMAASDKERGAAAQRAEQILMQMVNMYEKGDSNVKPDETSFHAVLSAWSRSRENCAIERALQVLYWMIKLNEHHDTEVVPDLKCFQVVLNLIAESGKDNAGILCEKIFVSMEKLDSKYSERLGIDIRPQTIHYNMLLEAWRKSNHSHAAQRAQEILNYMEGLADSGAEQVEPNLETYAKVIEIVAKCKHCKHEAGPARATFLLKKLEEKYEATEDESLVPSNFIYNLVINAWAKSGYHEAPFKAKKLLERMYESKMTPDVYSCTGVIDACAHTSSSAKNKSKRKIYEIAREVFDEMSPSDNSSLMPSHVTYGTMLQACVNLLPCGQSRNDIVRDIIQKCKEDGQMGSIVLTRLQQVCDDSNLLNELLEGRRKNDLPDAWTSDVREKRIHYVPAQYKKKTQKVVRTDKLRT